MKTLITTLALFLMSTTASAMTENVELRFRSCANSKSQINNISGLIEQASPWGRWVGEHDGQEVVGTFTKEGRRFEAGFKLGSSSYGPYTVRICDNNGNYSAQVLFFTLDFWVQDETHITIRLPFGGGIEVTMEKVESFDPDAPLPAEEEEELETETLLPEMA